MPYNLVISDPTNFTGLMSPTAGGDNLNNFGGIGSWIAVPFMATENLILNKCMIFCPSSSGLGSIMVGFGTWDGNSPSTSGSGQSLNFSSQSLFLRTALTNNGNAIFTVPDYNIEAGKKYFMGLQSISRTTMNYNITFLPMNQTHLADGELGNYAVNLRGQTGDIKRFSSNHSSFNWGYNSGSGRTLWYNPMYGGLEFQAADTTRYSLSSTGSSQFGMSLYIDWNVNAVEMEEFGFAVRSSKASYGAGVTYNVILYDSDGTTPLTASTQSYMPTTTTSVRKVFVPLKYTLKTKKEYFIAFNRDSANASTDYVASIGYPSEVMAGNSVTTYVFTKASPSSTPLRVDNQILFHDISISKVYGNRQGGKGDIIRKYNPVTGQYIGNVEGY